MILRIVVCGGHARLAVLGVVLTKTSVGSGSSVPLVVHAHAGRVAPSAVRLGGC